MSDLNPQSIYPQDGFTALHIAAEEGLSNVVQVFLDHGAPVNFPMDVMMFFSF